MKKLLLLGAVLLLQTAAVRAGTIYDTPVKDIDGKETNLEAYKGKVMFIVNVASKCGTTPQYAPLEADYEKYKDQGFIALGFPCNQFKAQEPGSDAEIKQFCTDNYHTTFPLFDKIEVNGPGRNPLYDILAGSGSPYAGDIKWNFTKFLVGRDGKILARFEPMTKPDSPQVIQAIESALAAK